MSKLLSVKEVSEFLGVSYATVTNWEKTGLIRRDQSSQGRMYPLPIVQTLREGILSGKIPRLNQRRNKIFKQGYIFPTEYCPEERVRLFTEFVSDLSEKYYPGNLINGQIFITAYYLVLQEKSVNNPLVIKLLDELRLALGIESQSDLFDDMTALIQDTTYQFTAKNFDLLGTVYLYATSMHSRKAGGQYFTPNFICESMVNDVSLFLPQRDSLSVLDPAAGSGNFLLALMRLFSHYRNPPMLKIAAWEKDTLLCKILNFNLKLYHLVYYSYLRINFEIAEKDSLKRDGLLEGTYDAIIGNPPWGKAKNIQEYSCYDVHTGSEDIASLFIERAVTLLNRKGVLAYVVPSSLFTIRMHTRLRKFLFEHAGICKLTDYDLAFKSVIAPCLSFIAMKNHRVSEIEINLFRNPPRSLEILFQSADTLSSTGDPFMYYIPQEVKTILKKMDETTSEDYTLKNSKWALGVVTGNNKLHLSRHKTPNNEPIFTGKEVGDFHFSPAKWYIEFGVGKYQQVAPESLYRAPEKLVYKFISRDIVFSYDNSGSLVLNSANIVIPPCNLKVLCLLLNSSPIRFYYREKFRTHKTLRTNLESLPFPRFDKNQESSLMEIARHLSSSALTFPAIAPKIDRIVASAFRFTDAETSFISSQLNRKID